uniref:NCK-associated protein 5-like n=1 Tax=Cyprinus carpio TaxID=7962 RepID=A0A8C2GAF7_CYPCA
MSEEAQNRVDEDFESEEGDLESYLEEESNSELLERVRELQAENSALSLANESQREAYERCLDEVANHVVQALLNQKDLREECIKLKMRVFDLERQNRTLCELLQEKLHKLYTKSLSQSCMTTLPYPYDLVPQGNSECAQNCIPETQGSSTSMEAMSPFLKKKAHILEVLRKLEETDPLRYHRSSGIPSICDYSQALASKEAVLACRDNTSRCNAPKAHCSHSCPDVCTHQHLNGGEHKDTDCVCQANVATSKLPTSGLKDNLQNAHCEMDSNEPVHKGLLFSPNENHTASKVLDDISVPVKDTPSDPQSIRSKVVVSTNQVSCLREVKASPSKLLKFLKIPTLGERTAVPAPPRLSPQLTRSSKIPCRSHNYEVNNSPVATRKATTTERQRQLPPSKSESHSAPTSPPHSHIQKTPQKIPHYENVSDISKTCSTDVSQLLGEVSSSLQNSSPANEESDSSDQEDSSESPVWHKQVNHRSLPSQSSSQKAQSGISTRSRTPNHLLKGTIHHLFLRNQGLVDIQVNQVIPNLEAAQALRSYAKSTTPHSLSYNGKNVAGSHSASPNKIALKSPTKTVPPSMNRDGKPTQEFQRYMSKSEDRSHLRANKKKNSSYGESLPPPPPRPVESAEEKRHSAPSPQSSIEQKVMKGIEENMMKLHEQDKGQMTEVKQKASNGIANWFGLRKSKLPALSRKPEMSKSKDDKREWKLNISSVGKDSKGAAKKTESESLNISMLIEKAEGLHKALEEERAYVNGVALDRQGKGHSCEVVMDQAQGQLSVMYRGVPSDNFMQQLLNRLVSALLSKDVTSDENLAETIHHEHFAGSGISTYTLDSGIGTFPLPDYSANAGCKSIPKGKAHGESDPTHLQGKHGSGMKISHKAWTLERELSCTEEDYMGGQDMDHHTMFLFTLFLSFDLFISGTDICGAPMKLGPTKNWTFPNLKASAEPSEVYLGVGDGVEPVSHKTSFKRVSITLDPSVTQQDNYNNFLFN